MTRDFEELLVCKCESAEHQLIFKGVKFMVDEEEKHWVFVTTHLAPSRFWSRLWHGLRYIFGYRCKYGHFDEVILTEDHVEKLENVVKFLKGLRHGE